MDKKEKIRQIMELKGPILPSDIYKAIETNLLMASVILSEMSSKNEVIVSHLKIGTSPLYYLPKHKEKLQQFIGKLNEKDGKTCTLLKERKILQDDEQDSLTRVSLRQIKDFAVPFKVKMKDRDIIFWKWYILSDPEVESLIKDKFEAGKKDAKPKDQGPEKVLEKIPEKDKADNATDKSGEQKHSEHKSQKEVLPEADKKETKETKETTKPVENKAGTEQQKFVDKTEKKQIKKRKRTASDEGFIDKVLSYISKSKISIIEKLSVKRTEIDFVVEVPSVVGQIQYFCRAKNKKKVNDSDIAAAFIQSQQKKLPLLFLVTGDLTKKANQMLDKEFKGTTVKKIQNGS